MRPKRIVLLFLVLVVLAGVSVGAPPRVKFTQSPVKIAVFTWCSSGVCVPLTYRWQGSVRVEYDYYYDASIGTNRVLIRKFDQSVTMFAAASNPCRIGMGVTTKGYDKWGNYYWTIKKTHPGDYIYGSTSLFWGGVAYPNWWIPGPKLTTTAVAAGTGNGCLGAPSLSWDTYLP